MKKTTKFTKIKGERGGMSFSRFNGYSSDQAAKNARDKMVKQLAEEGKTCERSTTNGYTGGTMHKMYQITGLSRKCKK
jgi:hypothetical protein